MGGYGSNRWSWAYTRLETDGLLCLDVRWLQRQGYISAPLGRVRTTVVSWASPEQVVGAIMVRVYGDGTDAVLLDYCLEGGDGCCVPVREWVRLDRTPCHYGGERVWFLCPGCGTRRAILYCVAGRFHCRACHDLAYSSTRESPIDRRVR